MGEVEKRCGGVDKCVGEVRESVLGCGGGGEKCVEV